MDDSFTAKAVVNNEYDYSNILPTVDVVSYLVQYCDSMNKELTRLVEEDEEKNKQFKAEYTEYMYKHNYGQKLEVYIVEKTYQNITCNDYTQFKSAVDGGNLKEVKRVEIKMCLDFYRGKGETLEEHENTFVINFEPYEIKFSRKSNHSDPIMDQIEQQILDVFKQMPVANSIFCTK